MHHIVYTTYVMYYIHNVCWNKKQKLDFIQRGWGRGDSWFRQCKQCNTL